MSTAVLVNGKAMHTLPVADRAFAYGDGVFETIRVTRSGPILWDYHLERLQAGCDRLEIRVSSELASLCADWVRELSEQVGWQDAEFVAKLVVTRGEGGRGYRPVAMPPNYVVSLHSIPSDLQRIQQEGMNVKVLKYRLPRNEVLAGIKHLNRLDQVMASLELGDEDEGIVCDHAGSVIEGTKSNLLLFTDSGLLTPSLDCCGVAGVMRRYILERASDFGLCVHVGQVSLRQLHEAKAVAMINSLMGLCPVRRLNGTEFPVPAVVRNFQSLIHEALHL